MTLVGCAPVKSRASEATAEHAIIDLTPKRFMKTGQLTSGGGASSPSPSAVAEAREEDESFSPPFPEAMVRVSGSVMSRAVPAKR